MRYLSGIRSRIVRHAWRLLAVTMLCCGATSSAQTALSADISLFGDDFPPTMELRNAGGRNVIVRKDPPPKEATAGYSQTLVFRDGHELRGETVEISGGELVWKRSDAGDALRFPLSMIRRIATDLPGKHNSEPAQITANDNAPVILLATVKLPGTDWIFGEVTSADGQTFTIRAADWTLTVGRAQIEWLYFGSMPAPAFGIGGSAVDFTQWESDFRAVEMEGHSFTVGEGWLGRSIVPPMRFLVSLEVPEDGEDGTRLWLQPFGTRPNAWGLGTTQFQFGREEISHLLFVNKIDPQKTPLPKDTREEKGPVRYRLYWDGYDKRATVQRNGRLLGDWKYPADQDFQFEGICLDRVDANDIRKPLKFNRLSIQPWDGVISRADENRTDQDRQSGGKPAGSTEGDLQSLTSRAMEFSAVMQPLKPGTFLQLRGPPAPTLGDAEARVVLDSRGEFNARHLVIRDGKLECETAFARALEVPLSAISSLAFRDSPHLPPDPAAGDMLVFKNGDELPGKALAASRHDGVRWKTLPGQEIVFQPGRIAGVRLANSAASGTDHAGVPADDAVVELRSGERFGGKLLAYEDSQVRMENPLLGTIALDRSRLWRLFPRLPLQAFGGTSTGGGWAWGNQKSGRPGDDRPMVGSSPIIALNGTYISRIGADAYDDKPNDLPGVQHTIDRSMEQFEVRFDAICPSGNTSDFMLILHGDNETTLTLDVSWWRLYVRVSSAGRRRPSRRAVSFQDKIAEPDLRRTLRLFVNTKAGTCDVVLNGTLLTRIGTEAGERISQANYRVTLTPMPESNVPTIFSNLWLGSWNGQLPMADIPATGQTTLTNGDVIPSVPKAVHDGKIKIDSELGELNVPLGNALLIDFGGVVDKQRSPGQVRLKDGSLVNVDEFHWDGRSLTAHSAILGEVRLPGENVREIIYDPSPPRELAIRN